MSTAGNDLVSGVLTRISHLEADAREAAKYSSAQWDSATSAVVDLGGGDLDDLIPVPASPIANHMVAHDPHAVLRLCWAHRQIVELHRAVDDRTGYGVPDEPGGYGSVDPACGECGSQDMAVPWPCPTLRDLAVGLGVVEEDR